MSDRRASILPACAAEAFGTFILVLFGVGAVHVAVLTGALHGLWQVAVVWGAAVSLAIFATAAASGAHINPAITIAFATWRRFPWSRVAPYIISQTVGAFLAAALLYALFSGYLASFETTHHIVRGGAGSECSAMVFGEYFPNPALATADSVHVSRVMAMAAEGIGAMFLALFVLVLTDASSPARPPASVAPLVIGLALAMLIMLIAPLTQAGFNPARDFGPRLFSWLAGWGSVAIPGPRGGFFTVYILSPVLGALAGAGVYERIIRPVFFRSAAIPMKGTPQ